MSANRSTVGFNFLREPELPAPQVSESQARDILVTHFGVHADVESLGSQQDRNFLVGQDDTIAGVLKVANPAFNEIELTAQELAADLIAQAEPDLRVAQSLPNQRGEKLTAVTGLDPDQADGTAYVRLLRHLPGGTLIESGYLPPATVAELGALAGRVSRALAGFSHPGLDRILQWDLRFGADVVSRLVSHVDDASARSRLQSAAEQAWSRIEPLADALPRQTVHMDLTDANVMVSRGVGGVVHPDGIIDLGDLADSWAVSELAITLSSVLQHPGADPAAVLPGIRAFHAIRPLSVDEAEALWPLLVLRTAVLIVSGAHQAGFDPDNDYLTEQADGEWQMFERATSVPIDVMTALIKADLGLASPPAPVRIAPPLIASAESVVTLDLGATSDALDDAFSPGGWVKPDVEDELARAAIDDGATLVVTRFGQPRISRAPALSQDEPEVVPTGISLWPADRLELTAPFDGAIVERTADSVTFRGSEYELTLTGITATDGGLGIAEPGRWTELALRPIGAPRAPALTTPGLAPGWLACSRDPRPLLGLSELDSGLDSGSADADLVARRDRAFAPVQEHYYRRPPRIERGWRHFLMSTSGRCYLDMVNNVTVLGHAHPRVAAAATRQLRKLNTNSRFNYASVVEFSERLAGLLPDPLDTVFLVNSGSEASDLALRLATAAAGRPDVVAMREAYHGWTYGTDAVSTSTADNPNALATRPDWVHTVESPNSFRGKYRGDDVGRYAVDAVAQINGLIADGRAPAAFICETVYGNAGGMALPDGYLQQIYAAIRGAGGYAVADEVQVGYGRLGEWFWGFAQQGVVPDIVSMAKSVGNGYPLGAVVTSREIAERFRSQGYFFSSPGGSPLSCEIGMTVLDVLNDEGLQRNAARVGAHLKSRLQELAVRHPIIGTVHGVGLYLGVEMIRDPQTLEPATEETALICDRMLELGVIIQPTGDHQNILKTKPPLCIDVEAADFYVDALDRVLTEGW
ncbi:MULTISPECIES: aminotransferase [unclassified Mycolicibacterium]|uniref:aminotransferase n=1 Tax=unclassified Mycolicibacterium TaxID=2636767 RepID=UPI00130B35B8|nr:MULTISPECIES: aminotransferase [unclassified Mycolicibacterium]MUL85098.1 aminotransferase [Mycolicibacterium sp. CBMA 329]MUL91065.1 aminotransferase [Mycolicibacterium sp. CBMA 331]MUL98264.1 aminotransferase [Mycolicibacterium sp. CBMA 334]MUM26142.1 aminotransferase [Mycolicibacterium sp. CBMA 295]MUM40824.1 aminotransferase [Mycolicibacterium sp. CBMA 247]